MLKIWGRKSSSNVQALTWRVGELGLPYERVDAGFIYGVVNTPEYLAMNPNGTLPTLQDGENPPLWETGAILRYLANSYAPHDFWPTDRIARANVDRWSEWSKLNVALNFTAPIFWRVVRTPLIQSRSASNPHRARPPGPYLDIAETQLAKSAYLAGQPLHTS